MMFGTVTEWMWYSKDEIEEQIPPDKISHMPPYSVSCFSKLVCEATEMRFFTVLLAFDIRICQGKLTIKLHFT